MHATTELGPAPRDVVRTDHTGVAGAVPGKHSRAARFHSGGFVTTAGAGASTAKRQAKTSGF
jgi:hypothetical protein